MADEELPVAVIGGGIVGPVLTHILAERGFTVHLYEARPPSLDTGTGRAINLSLSSRGLDALKRIGATDQVLKETTPFYGRCIHLPGGKTKIQYYSVKRDSIQSMNRRRLSEILLQRVEKLPNVNVYYEHKLISIENNEILQFKVRRDQDNGINEKDDRISVRVKFIFGCDGFNSAVRKNVLGSILKYDQQIMDEVYHELYLPPTPDGGSALEHTDLFHLWPLGEVMMAGIPNKGNSFNMILFTPLSISETLKTPNNVLEFFEEYFPDLLQKMDKKELINDFFRKSPSRLNTIKCYPYHYGNVLLLGDAAHSVLPFYGQGMNAGLEDCLIFEECLDEKDDDLQSAASLFSERRCEDLHVLADQSLANFTVLRAGVKSNWFWFKIKLEALLSILFPNIFKQIYPMVVFSRARYSEVLKREKWQERLVETIAIVAIIIIIVTIIGYCLYLLFL